MKRFRNEARRAFALIALCAWAVTASAQSEVTTLSEQHKLYKVEDTVASETETGVRVHFSGKERGQSPTYLGL